MQAADKIDLTGKNQTRAVRHGRRFAPADHVELNFEAVLLGHTGFFENRQQRPMRRVARQ
jgi:hypothetical protein